MRTEEEIREKIDEIESEKGDIEDDFKTTLEDESIEEDSDQGEKMRSETDQKLEAMDKQIELLEWVLGE